MVLGQPITKKTLAANIRDGVEDGKHFCFILGAGASYSSGIKTGKQLAFKWMSEIEKEYNGNFEKCIIVSHFLRKEKEMYYDFREILNAFITARDNGEEEMDSKYYFDVYRIRFPKNSSDGYRAIEEEMESAFPSYGYQALARILSTHRDINLVITTNFDDLIEKSLVIYTGVKPIVINHESLAQFATDAPNRSRPIIAEIHRGLFFNPLNDRIGTTRLKGNWREVLKELFRTYIPIVIGYAGGDYSLMELLEEDSTKFCSGLYWCCYSERDLENERIVKLLENKNGIIVENSDFDSVMLEIANCLSDKGVDENGVHYDYTNLSDYLFRENADIDIEKVPETLLNNAYSHIVKYIVRYAKTTYISQEDFKKENLNNLIDRLYEWSIDPSNEHTNLVECWQLLFLGVFSCEKKEYFDACKCFYGAVMYLPDCADIYYLQGISYRGLFDYESTSKNVNILLDILDKALNSFGMSIEFCADNNYEIILKAEKEKKEIQSLIEIYSAEKMEANNSGNIKL